MSQILADGDSSELGCTISDFVLCHICPDVYLSMFTMTNFPRMRGESRIDSLGQCLQITIRLPWRQAGFIDEERRT